VTIDNDTGLLEPTLAASWRVKMSFIRGADVIVKPSFS